MNPFKPLATYRLQFNKNFRFNDALNLVDYFRDLGIDTVYASPIFAAIPESMHGYDVVDPQQINPEIGTEEELVQLTHALKQSGISWIQDIVPNHMAFHPQNKRLMDVLVNGVESQYYPYFDFDVAFAKGEQLTVPFLGGNLEELIQKGSVYILKKAGQYYIHDGSQDWPLKVDMQPGLLEADLAEVNADKALLSKIVQGQYYRLCDWASVQDGVNYRRFFTVNELICLNMQKREVFDDYHHYILKLVKKGIFQGLRIDHVDGLYDPSSYLEWLRAETGPACYIIVEKILASDEPLASQWPVQGSTGYDFLAMVNNVFTKTSSAENFDDIYRQVTGTVQIPRVKKMEKKQQILNLQMRGELKRLAAGLLDVPELKISGKEAEAFITDLLVNMPRYRFYDISFPLNGQGHTQVSGLLDTMGRNAVDIKSHAFWTYLLIDYPRTASALGLEKLGCFFNRLMQYSGPVMAKGVEDTLMYTYNRFIGHAEVGDQAEQFGIPIEKFHALMEDRARKQPYSLNATATHDTKKGEDVRARLNVLSDLPEAWKTAVNKTMEKYAVEISTSGLHANDLYLLFQTLLGIYPYDQYGKDGLADRLAAFMEKALREAKKRSDWAMPEVAYEQKIKAFSKKVCNDLSDEGHPLLLLFNQITDHAIINSFSQVILKVCCPGIPDFYQGCEAFDLNLVDPDNRRPVDYGRLRSDMAEICGAGRSKVWENRLQGKAKVELIKILLQIRKTNRALFEEGTYLPLEVKGKYSEHVLVFLRHLEADWLMVAVPLGTAGLGTGREDFASFDWKDTRIILPLGVPQIWKNLVSDELAGPDVIEEGLPLGGLLKKSFAAVAVPAKPERIRQSGVLLHISSLPSDGPIGDLGPEAYRFVDFLQESSQHYWQLLPLGPVAESRAFSPYSTWSDKAGNIQLISLELLEDWGLLPARHAQQTVGSLPEADFYNADSIKRNALEQAYQVFLQQGKHTALQQEFITFKQTEHYWLSDYALYCSLSVAYQGSWRSWPEEFKWRDKVALETYQREYATALEKYEWEQFVFWKQWHLLRRYAKQREVSIIGDLPFYIDLDAVEVWCNPRYFLLDDEGSPLFQAGVPPDYFNKSGQRWGMPVYNWEKIAEQEYSWWVDRISYQLSKVDELRLDHFRAFSAFYQIPQNDTDARNGIWKKAPGDAMLTALQQKIGKLPLIAEDLGEITTEVYELMEKFQLPGMKVLQFAFGSDLLTSVHIPHDPGFSKGIVYAGTHDNNTTKGWFNELDEKARDRLQAYLGQSLGEQNVAHQLIRLALSSAAFRAILTMQDILGLGEEARMNYPGQVSGNWSWRLSGREDFDDIAKRLSQLTRLYGRGD